MPAYFLVEIMDVFDAPKYGQYIAGVKDIVERGGGEYIIRSDRTSPFLGDPCPVRVILIKFEDRAGLDNCFASREYKEIAPLREASTRARACIIEDG